jgi:phage terminase large subunit
VRCRTPCRENLRLPDVTSSTVGEAPARSAVLPFEELDEARRKLAYAKAAQHVRQVKEIAPSALAALQKEIARRSRMSTLRSSVPPVFLPFFDSVRYKGAHGGRGSAKSWSFATMLLDRCLTKSGTRVVCVREVQRSLEQSVKRLLEDLIVKHDVGAQFRVLNTHIETPGDGVIIFQGMNTQTAESIKSLEGYDIAWVEEAQVLSARSLMLLRPTLRKEDSELWFTWNPRRASDPIDQFLRSGTPPSNSLVIQATYHDNPFLPEVLKAEIAWDQRRDPEKYNHIWLGGYERHSEARVFRNWVVEEFETPSDAEFLFGGDWGFAVDPSVLVRGYIVGKKLFVDCEAYRVGCEIDDTPALFDSLDPAKHGMARSWLITTDSARPETISYMQRHGYPRVVGAKKGPGSVEEGIQFLKTYDIVVHPRCTHVVDELTMYSFKKHPLTDEVMPVLEDRDNHTIDSLRYMVESVRQPASEGWCTW